MSVELPPSSSHSIIVNIFTNIVLIHKILHSPCMKVDHDPAQISGSDEAEHEDGQSTDVNDSTGDISSSTITEEEENDDAGDKEDCEDNISAKVRMVGLTTWCTTVSGNERWTMNRLPVDVQ